jgi:hypothetical protein
MCAINSTRTSRRFHIACATAQQRGYRHAAEFSRSSFVVRARDQPELRTIDQLNRSLRFTQLHSLVGKIADVPALWLRQTEFRLCDDYDGIRCMSLRDERAAQKT